MGGLVAGIGLGIVFRFGGTTGGSDLIGSILNKSFPSIGIATFMMGIDGLVVIFAGIVAKNIDASLYSIISLFTTAKVIDLILEGIGYSKGFLIITGKPEEISQRIMADLDRGITLFKGTGMYSKEEKDVLLCVVSRSQFMKTKNIVNDIDNEAFIMVTEMSEVLGEGFEEIKKIINHKIPFYRILYYKILSWGGMDLKKGQFIALGLILLIILLLIFIPKFF